MREPASTENLKQLWIAGKTKSIPPVPSQAGHQDRGDGAGPPDLKVGEPFSAMGGVPHAGPRWPVFCGQVLGQGKEKLRVGARCMGSGSFTKA